ncbi:apolipoprotein N-acyltransferase [uncultured Sphingomonas sp.]|uniref:apolipoprotein N-acyltransferase n=1 Tax=uncultured Sphingomonas sp. TaxID=158754 RepID=UPI0035CC76DE
MPPALACLLLGALAALGFAPLQLWPLTLAGLAGWLALVHAAPTRRAAMWRGWLFGVGHFTVNDNWIQHAFDFQDAMPPVLGYGAAVGLALYLALFPMTAAAIAWSARGRRPDAAFALAAGAAWIATEWLRGRLFTGYPWDPIAAIWVPVQPIASVAAWVGTYALSGVTVAAAALLRSIPRRPRPLAAAIGVLAALLAAQAFSYSQGTARSPPDSYPRLVVVQPNVNQNARGDDDAEPILRRLLSLSGGPAPYPRLILWPEGMVRDYLEDGYPFWIYGGRYPWRIRPRLARVLGARDTLLVGATPLRFGAGEEPVGAGNAVQAIGPDARLHGRYDKAHLVPYGEYLPMPWLLKPLGLARLVPGGLDFDPGPGPRAIDIPGIGAVGVQICYEIVFSGQVVDRAQRPRLIFNPSNDAWFGRWGPPQHLAQARLRAIEEGLPIVRATPTGISAVIGADGALLAQLPLGRTGTLTVPLPQPSPPTLFSRLGNRLALGVGLLLAAAAVALRRRAR